MSSPAPTTVPEQRPAAPRRWLALGVIAVAQLMVALDATVVNIALPTAQATLGFDDGARQWVVTGYTCTLAGFLLLGGRLADRVGHRRAFLLGLTGFALASAIAGTAPGLEVLLAGRALQGACAAVLTPTALSMVAVTFTEPQERAKAFGVYGAVASSGAAVGLIAGGLLTEYAGWRWCLYVNVVVAAVAGLTGRLVLPGDGGRSHGRTDVLSGLLATLGLGAAVLGCSQAAERSWAAPLVLGPVAAGTVSAALFWRRQRRSEQPLLPPWVLADRSRAGAYLAAAAAMVGAFGMFLMLTYHFQVVLGWSPVRAGAAFLPMTLAVSASAYGLGSRLLPRVAPRMLIVPGLLLAAGGLGLLARLTAEGAYLATILPAEVLLGAGMGLVVTPAISVATSDIEPRYAGVAAATATTAMQVGGALGAAALNSVAVAATQDFAVAHGASASALVHGYSTSTTAAALVLVVGALLATVLVLTPRPEAKEGQT
ncbi:MAG: MFS transporter [Nocardioides sp.]